MIEIEVNIHRQAPVLAPNNERIESIVSCVLEEEGADGTWTVAVVFVDDAEMLRMHRDFMAMDEPTDIMTFPSDPDVEGSMGGDLVISADTAAAQAEEHGNTPEQEIEFLIAHGMLHLLGWNDADPGDRASMLDRQTEILANLN